MNTEILELLKELIRQKPVSTDIEAVNRATALMEKFLKKNGLFCTIEDFNGRHVLYASTRQGKVTDFLFNAHLDVVPAASEGQYEPIIRDGKLFARGGHDCLGNAAVIAAILCEAKEKYSVGAFFTADEEIGGSTTAGMVKRGYKGTKTAIILDSGCYNIAYGQKGIIEAKLIAKGNGGHASTPWQYDDPIGTLFRAYLKLADEWKNPTAEEPWSDSLAPCIISGGAAANQIPDQAELVVNIRYIDDSHRETIIKKLKDTGLDVEIFAECPPVIASTDNEAIRGLKNAIKKITGKDIFLYRMNGATDARHLKALNIPILILGTPGEGAHQSNEWLSIDGLPTTVAIFRDFLANF